MQGKILVSAGETSSDLYAGQLVTALSRRLPEAEFFGCAGRRMQAAGVRPVVDASRLSVVGLVEVIRHIPSIHREFRRLLEAARRERPRLAILADSPDFHLRLAPRLKRLGIPIIYLVAPQVWAWRKGRIPAMRRNIDRLLCIFPFEEPFFRRHGIQADYIGHPLARHARPSLTKEEFYRKHRIPRARPLVLMLPGSRLGETARHAPYLLDAMGQIRRDMAATFLWAMPPGRSLQHLPEAVRARAKDGSLIVTQGETWDALAHGDLALAASGTVAMEAALLGIPMVTFYRVTGLSWLIGKFLVDVPFYTMVNLVAERKIVPELIQREMTGERIAAEALRLLRDPNARAAMRSELQQVAAKLRTTEDPIERAASIAEQFYSHGGHYVQ
jgi:lipid-A-disaccharide synthase